MDNKFYRGLGKIPLYGSLMYLANKLLFFFKNGIEGFRINLHFFLSVGDHIEKDNKPKQINNQTDKLFLPITKSRGKPVNYKLCAVLN